MGSESSPFAFALLSLGLCGAEFMKSEALNEKFHSLAHTKADIDAPWGHLRFVKRRYAGLYFTPVGFYIRLNSANMSGPETEALILCLAFDFSIQLSGLRRTAGSEMVGRIRARMWEEWQSGSVREKSGNKWFKIAQLQLRLESLLKKPKKTKWSSDQAMSTNQATRKEPTKTNREQRLLLR